MMAVDWQTVQTQTCLTYVKRDKDQSTQGQARDSVEYYNDPKCLDTEVCANGVDPDQTVPEEAV